MTEIQAEDGVHRDSTGATDAVPSQINRIVAALAQGAVFVGGIGYILLPFVLWIAMRSRSPFVAYHAKQAFLSQSIVLVLFILACVLGAALDDSNIAVGLCFAVGIPWCLGSVYAVVKALSGEHWHYPGLGWAV